MVPPGCLFGCQLGAGFRLRGRQPDRACYSCLRGGSVDVRSPVDEAGQLAADRGQSGEIYPGAAGALAIGGFQEGFPPGAVDG